MQLPEKILLAACIMTFLAILNWISGDRGITGEQLQARTGGPWVAMRWFGLGLVIAGAVLHREGDLKVSWLMAVGAGILLLGTARKELRLGGRRHSETPLSGIKTPVEQAVSSEGDKPPN